MIQAITPDSLLRWQCMGGEEDEHCLAELNCHVSEATYQRASVDAIGQEVVTTLAQANLVRRGRRRPAPQPGRGSVIALPECPECGARCFLKADYTIKELYKTTVTIPAPNGGIWGYALKRGHLYNLMVHHWLYLNGQAEHAPVLALPDPAELRGSELTSLSTDTLLALWFGYAIVSAHKPRLANFEIAARERDALPPLLAFELPWQLEGPLL